jgi:cytochrome c oxidase subunit 4
MSANERHITPPRTYLIVFGILILGTILTVGIDLVDRELHILPHAAHSWISMSIAVVKASLVILFFMHIWYSSWLNWLVAGGGLLWLGILIVYTLTDYVSRTWLYVPGH